MMIPESRRLNLQRLKEEAFDVLILGGGINGAGIARDLALRARRAGVRLKIGLVEQRHFASGTSGKNSQLIHGGLRYLKQLEFHLVRESLRERATLLQLAPHLVETLPFLIPLYGWFTQLFYGAGLWLYYFLAGDRSLGKPCFLSALEVTRIEPGLARQGLTGGAIFFDCRVNSARFVLENIFDAAAAGAVVANYARAELVTSSGATVVDELSGARFPVRARKIVDATGPWEKESQVRPVRGSHLVLPRINAGNHAIAHFDESGRIVFLIPWGDSSQLSLVGTTDCDHTGGPDSVWISREEVVYLLRIVRRLFPAAAAVQPIAAYSSLRALLRSDADSPTKTSREHRIWTSANGVLHVAGGKYTTYRAMSEEAVDTLVREIAPELKDRCVTSQTPLGGNTRALIEQLLSSAARIAGRCRLERAQVVNLIRHYGVQTESVLQYLPESGDRLARAQIAYAVKHEMAQRLPDLLFVSTYWGYEQPWSAQSLAPLAAEMGAHLGWDERRIQGEVDLALRLTAKP